MLQIESYCCCKMARSTRALPSLDSLSYPCNNPPVRFYFITKLILILSHLSSSFFFSIFVGIKLFFLLLNIFTHISHINVITLSVSVLWSHIHSKLVFNFIYIHFRCDVNVFNFCLLSNKQITNTNTHSILSNKEHEHIS
jgi:hypothetical protein